MWLLSDISMKTTYCMTVMVILTWIRIWNMYGMKMTGMFIRLSSPENCARIIVWISADRQETGRLLISSPVGIWMIRDMETASITNVILSVPISVRKYSTGGKPVVIYLIHVIVRTFQAEPVVPPTLLRHCLHPGCVMQTIRTGFILKSQEKECMTMENISTTFSVRMSWTIQVTIGIMIMMTVSITIWDISCRHNSTRNSNFPIIWSFVLR